jgi:ubiquinone/menaquinone biosynthesis C-methylase UbiE
MFVCTFERTTVADASAPAQLPQLFNAAMASHLDRLYASPQVVAQRQRLRELIAAQPGERGLDVGCGLAHLSCELALDVGTAGRIVGIDASADMVAGAAERAARLGVADRVEVRQGDATALDLPDASVDFAVAVQSYSYVPRVEQAIAEAARVLRPGGRLAVLETDWDLCIYRSSDDAQMRRLFDGRWRFAHWTLPRELHRMFRDAGLRLATAEAFPIVETRYDPASFGVGLIAVARNAAVRHGVDAGAADAWVADIHARGQDGDYFFCVNRFMFIAVK